MTSDADTTKGYLPQERRHNTALKRTHRRAMLRLNRNFRGRR